MTIVYHVLSLLLKTRRTFYILSSYVQDRALILCPLCILFCVQWCVMGTQRDLKPQLQSRQQPNLVPPHPVSPPGRKKKRSTWQCFVKQAHLYLWSWWIRSSNMKSNVECVCVYMCSLRGGRVIMLTLVKRLFLPTPRSLYENRNRFSESVDPQIILAWRFKQENGEASKESSHRTHRMTYLPYATHLERDSLQMTSLSMQGISRMLCAFVL